MERRTPSSASPLYGAADASSAEVRGSKFEVRRKREEGRRKREEERATRRTPTSSFFPLPSNLEPRFQIE
jgi:hypothetical protein